MNKKYTSRWLSVFIVAIILLTNQTGKAGVSEVQESVLVDSALKLPSRELPLGVTWFDTDMTETMFDWQEHVTEKPLQLLLYGKEGRLRDFDIVVGGTFWGTYMYEEGNIAGKFPILSRFPSQHGNRSRSGEEWIINNAALSLIVRGADWLTVYVQPEYTEIEFPGQTDWQLRKVYAVVGNLERFPFYFYFGRNTVDFGSNDAYNPFTHSVNNHFFRTDTMDPAWGLGFYKNGFHVIATLIHSGRQLRVADTEDTDGWKNGALLASYTRNVGDFDLKVGGSFLYSTIYNRDVAHHPGDGFGATIAQSNEITRNPAVNGFFEVAWRDQLRAGVEYTTTTKDWPTTERRVEALNIQAAYDFKLFDMPSRLSAVYGLGKTGPSGTEYEKLSQLAIGFEIKPVRNIALGVEYVHNRDFVPLFGITSASDRDVATHTLIAGAKITF